MIESYEFAGKEKLLSDGLYPVVTLNEVRNEHEQRRELRTEVAPPSWWEVSVATIWLFRELKQCAGPRATPKKHDEIVWHLLVLSAPY
ncbi:MAG: hypothetical protein WBY53_18680 [Acidobacteriaceae bacterium]